MADGDAPTASCIENRVTFFASGSNHSGEIRAVSLIDGGNVGVCADRVHPAKYAAAFDALERFVECGRRVFIDSGAFAEVTFPGGVPTITKPLGDAHWRLVFDVYARLAQVHREDCYVVAPDCVAHQPESLARLQRYVEEIRDVAAFDATILVPIQKGALSMPEFYRRAAWILNGASADADVVSALSPDASAAECFAFGGVDFTPAIPMKKDATTVAELASFVRDVRPSSIHLLGMAPDTEAGQEAIRTVLAIVPSCRISCDACLIMRWVGETNGRGGGPRRVTALNHLHAAKLAVDTDALGEIKWRKRNEVHVRKLLSFFLAANAFWTDNGLADIVIPDRLALPDGFTLDGLEWAYLPLVVALYGRAS